jgi:rifampicin phosphotransferase
MILPLDAEVSLEIGGGKGANLARLARAGLDVPPGFILTTHAYRAFVSDNGLEQRILLDAGSAQVQDPASLEAASAAIRARLGSATLSTELAGALRAAYAGLGEARVAVRSSATTEDLPDLSFAGQHDTMLNVIGAAALLQAVVQCWSSLWTARAIAYRARNAISHQDAALAVVVQQMLASEVSGVLFTANPLTGKRSETTIEATLGLGEALVSGRVEPDHYRADGPAGRVLERRIGAKALSIRARDGGGTLEVPEHAPGRPALTDADVLALVRLGTRIADLFGTPQDVEWALAGGRIHVLQSRPITSFFPLPEGLPTDGLRVLLSIGAIQGMLDPITPLGQDVFRCALPNALASIGVPLATGDVALVAVAGERIFVDISAALCRARILSRVRAALRLVEPTTAEALDEVLAEGTLVTGASRLRWPSLRFVVLLGRALGNLAYDMLWPERGRARIQRRLAAAITAFEQRGALAHSLAERVVLLEQAFAWIPRTGLPLLGPGFGGGLANLRLLHALAAQLPEGELRVLEMMRGLPHNVTTEMDLALWDVARVVRSHPEAAELFRTGDPEALARQSLAAGLPAPVQLAVDAFLEKYGMRGVGEIDIGKPRWRDDPTPLLQVLQSYLRIEDGQQAPDVVFRRGAAAAEPALDSLLADARRTRLGPFKTFVLRAAARRMRALAGLRESPKFTGVAMLGVVRSGLLASGRELAALGTLATPDDVFFLHLDELKAIAAGRAQDWRARVRERRRTYDQEQRRRRIPRLLLSDGRALYGGSGGNPATAGAALMGTPVSPGVAAGSVRVMLDPRAAQLVPGEILVCRGTDPAWTPLFLAAAALVTEVGGLMTHGSVVAREYGIPAVVGVHEATTRLRTGQRVRVDGTKGRIDVLEE